MTDRASCPWPYRGDTTAIFHYYCDKNITEINIYLELKMEAHCRGLSVSRSFLVTVLLFAGFL
jgi:hypothetical protein